MRLIILFMISLLFLCPSKGSAEMISEQGIGQASYSNQSKKEAQEEAVHKAKLNTLNRYSSGFDIAKSNIYSKIRPIVEADIDRFLVDYVMLEESHDNDHKFIRVVVRANIDAGAVERELSKISIDRPMSTQQQSCISFVFVAREAKAVKKYDTRRTVQFMGESLDRGGKAGHSVRTVSSRVTVGGSTFKKADEINWNVSTVNEINTAMNNVFTTLGYEVVDAVDVYDASKGLLDAGKFIRDYKFGDDISATTRRNAIAGSRAADLDYLATGTLDIGMNDTVSPGIDRVYVSVTGKIWSIKTRFPNVVASVGPVQCAGLGPDQRVAKLNALKNAGEMVARELISQLRMKGIQ